jgi:hypothetical protein
MNPGMHFPLFALIVSTIGVSFLQTPVIWSHRLDCMNMKKLQLLRLINFKTELKSFENNYSI